MQLEPIDRFRRALDWAAELAEVAATDTATPTATTSDQPEQVAATQSTILLPPLIPVGFGEGFVRLSDLPPSTGVATRCGGRLIKREVTICVGDGGVGKGLFGVWLAAHITTGRPLPDEEPSDPMHVAVVTFEDSIAVWRQRFAAAGGNEEGLVIFEIENKAFDINRLHTLEQKWGLLIVDPALLLCAAEGISPNDNRRVREMLQKLQRVAQRLDCPVLIIHHPNSRGNILGGPTWRNAVRSVLELGIQADKSLGLLHTKHNNVMRQPPLWFKMGVKDDEAILEFLGANENLKPYIKPRPRVGDDDGSGKIIEQIAWMIETVASHNGDMARPELLARWTEETGLSDRTLRTVISLGEKMGKIVRVRITSAGTQSHEYRIMLKAVHEQDQVIDALMTTVDDELADLMKDGGE